MHKLAFILLLFPLLFATAAHSDMRDMPQAKLEDPRDKQRLVFELLKKGTPVEELLSMLDKEAAKYPHDKETMCMFLVDKAKLYADNAGNNRNLEKALQILEEQPDFCRDYYYLHDTKGIILEEKGDIEAAMKACKQGTDEVKDKAGARILQSKADFHFANLYSFSPEKLWEMLAANDKYIDKRVTVKGEIHSFEELPSYPCLRLVMFAIKGRIAFIACNFFEEKIAELRIGQTVTIQGIVRMMNKDLGLVFLDYCSLPEQFTGQHNPGD